MDPYDMTTQFLFRWLHIGFGSLWLGSLAFMTFVLLPHFRHSHATFDPFVKNLLLKSLTWLRAVSLSAFAFGFILMTNKSHIVGMKMFSISWGIFILLGGVIGLLMLISTWFFITKRFQKALLSDQTASAEEDPQWIKAEKACQITTAAAFPFTFFMIAANQYFLIPDPAHLVTIYFLCSVVVLVGFVGSGLAPYRPVSNRRVVLWGFGSLAFLFSIVRAFSSLT